MSTKLMRKYSKPMMAVLGVLLMVTFLVGYSYQSGMGGSGDAFVVGKLDGKPVTKGQLTRALIDVQVFRNLPALLDIGLYPVWLNRSSDTKASIQFYLLLREAREAGFFPDAGDINQMVKQKKLHQQISQFLSAQPNYAPTNIFEALDDLTTVDQMQQFVNGACLPSSPQLAHFISEIETSVQVRYTRLKAVDMASSMPAPTDVQLQKLFKTYRATLPWNPTSDTPPPLINGHRYPFGYRYADRVKIEFLKFDQDAELAKLKPTLQDIQAAYTYYQTHQDEFTITPADTTTTAANAKIAYQTFDQVRNELIRKQLVNRVALLFHRMLNRAGHIADKPWSTVDADGYHVAIPAAQWVSFKKLAHDLGSQYGYTPVVGQWDQWLNAADLSSLRGIGDATTDQAGLPQAEGLSVLAMKVRVLDPHSKGIGLLLHLQVGLDGPVLTDAQGNQYLYRIIAVSPAHNPATLNLVRAQVINDAQLLAAYQADQKTGRELEARAEHIGLPLAAKAYHLTVSSPPAFKALENKLVDITPDGRPEYQIVPSQLPGVLISSDKLMQTAFVLAHKALVQADAPAASALDTTAPADKQGKKESHPPIPTQLTLTHPCSSVALDPQLEVFVLQLINANPVPANILQNTDDLIGAGGMLVRNTNLRLMEHWFSYAAVVQRAGFATNN